MERKFLNEEKYQKIRKRIILIGVIIMTIGILIGSLLFAKGFTTKNIGNEKEELNSQIAQKQYECDLLEMGSSNWFADHSKCQREAQALKSQLSDLEMKAFGGTAFFMFGGFIILAGFMFGGFVIAIANKRNMLAYGAQTVVPIGKELVDEMAPSIGKVAGEVAKGFNDKK